MTREEYAALEGGDKVMLVDNIEEVAGKEWTELPEDTFTKDTIYIVNNNPRYPQDDWVTIQRTNRGDTDHGWNYKRWQLAEPETYEDVAEMYKTLGMEALDE